MSTTSSVAVTFERILVPTDFSEVSRQALEYAKTIARQENAELLLVHVSPPVDLINPPEAAWIDISEVQSIQQEQLEQNSAALRSEGYRARSVSATGPLCDELLSIAQQYKANLIVLGTHGKKGLERLMLGSDAEAVVRHATCPVLSVGPAVPDRKGKPWQIQEVLCATTLTPASARVVAFAHRLAGVLEAELLLFNVRDPKAEDDVDWESFQEAFHHFVPEDLGARTWLHTRLANASPAENIVDLAAHRGSSLIVMGAHGASSAATHLPRGTVARVLHEAPCPVMTLLEP